MILLRVMNAVTLSVCHSHVRMANQLSAELGLERCYEFGLVTFASSKYGTKFETTHVSWSNLDCNGWRLPTEAEWEYAARGGEDYKYAGGNHMSCPFQPSLGWHLGNGQLDTHPVGQLKANGYGLYDMSGNVSEWVWDSVILEDRVLSGESKYTSTPRVDPSVDKSSPWRVIRGGNLNLHESESRVSSRDYSNASFRYRLEGFRLLRMANQ